jgi:hypothetical protein
MGLRKTILAAGIGAAAAYFLDPANGPERRAKFQQKLDETMRKRGKNLRPSWFQSAGKGKHHQADEGSSAS